MSELVQQTELLDVATGELLPATVENAHRVLTAAREMKQRLQDVIDGTTAYLLEESRIQGTKTFHSAAGDITLTGGASVEYDPADLAEALRVAGCPEERIDAVVKATISYRVDRAVLKQLVAANPNYKAAAELAAREVEKPYRAATK